MKQNIEKHKNFESHTVEHQAQNYFQNLHKSFAFVWKGDRNYYNVALKKKLTTRMINDPFSIAERNVIYE